MKPIKPLIYYGSALYIGCIAYVFTTESKLLGAVIAASFLMIIFFTIEKRYFVIIMCFFIFGILINTLYYGYNYFERTEKIKVIKISSFYGIGRVKGRNLVISGNMKNIETGDTILVSGSFENKKDCFKGIVGEYNIEKVQTKCSSLGSFFANIKKKVYDKLRGNLGEEKAALIMSLCYGDTQSITEEQKYSFQKLGVIHAISVSGFHMAVIYKLIECVCGIWGSAIMAFLYLIFTGSQPATIRAFIMIIILKFSKKVFKSYDGISSLCLSAIIILTIKPFYALDLGFLLSYLATLGIILYYNKIRRTLYKLPAAINESLSLTLSAQTFSMPYAALSLGNISFGFIPGNLLLLPMYSILVVFGNIALLFLNIDFIFSMVCKLIYIILIILDGAHYLLLKISPPVSFLTFIEGMGLLFLISSFILVKKGFRKFRSLPIWIILVISMQYYSFFPSLQFINIGNEELLLIKYKTKSIIVRDEDINYSKDYDIINNRYLTRRTLSAEEGLTIKIKDNCIIKIHTNDSIRNNWISAEINSGGKTFFITRNIEGIKDVDIKKYDIIKLPDIKPYGILAVKRSRVEISSYKVIYNKIIAVSD